ncbi:MAG: methylated-DNA--[protein]-cysteine S-methyltransferase [Eubacteriales bacterium]|nr:methylated-DNA--[protein]-cysteine S-methyltransferase [Eubacteriales bacterium]
MKYGYTMASPIGRLTLFANETALTDLLFAQAAPQEPYLESSALLAQAALQLDEYFSGKRKGFDLPLMPQGTPFQKEVWRVLTTIPWGETRTYGEVAAALGRPGAARAVGGANHRNPLPIFIPCHRVVGTNGSLTGFGGGLEIKQWLLEHEQTAPAAIIFEKLV